MPSVTGRTRRTLTGGVLRVMLRVESWEGGNFVNYLALREKVTFDFKIDNYLSGRSGYSGDKQDFIYCSTIM